MSPHPDHLVVDRVSLDRGGRPVLQDISATFARSEVTAVVGPSGSGKSSLLRCLNRLEQPKTGRILLSGVDTETIPPAELRCRVGLVGQTPIIFPGGVRENLAYGLDDRSEHRLVSALEAVGLPATFLARSSDALSGGEAQRVCIARALARDPEILLLDEPTSALDRDAARTIEELIGSLAGRGLTMVLVTHDLAQACRIAPRGKLMAGGRLLLEGKMDEVEKAWPEVAG